MENQESNYEADTLVIFGGAVKALGDGRVGGYLVRFGSAEDVDLEQEYFDATTDFDVTWESAKTAVYYQHGLDATLKKRKLGTGDMRRDEVGVWVEAQLALRDKYERAIYQLVEEGKLGWSSGTAVHLVERERKMGATHLTRWPLGLDASLTPTPAEYRNGAVPLKSLSEVSSGIAPVDEGMSPPAQAVLGDEPDIAQTVRETDLPEDARPASVAVSDGAQPEISVTEVRGDETMSDETQEVAQTDAQKAAQPDPILNKLGEIADGLKTMGERLTVVENTPAAPAPIQVAEPVASVKSKAPAHNKGGLGDDAKKAFVHFLRTGDEGGIRHMKASNDTDMNIGTPGDGGYAVPTGHYQGIIARLDEDALYGRLGVMNIPGVGTTVNVPIDAEADGEFVSTNEATTFDRDSPAIGQVPMTLVKYTKRIELSYELLQDEDSRLMAFLENWVGRGMAKTHNQLLVTEALANGTAALTLDAVAGLSASEIPELYYKLAAEYAGAASWVVKRATEGIIRSKAGENWQFDPTPGGTTSSRLLWGAPIYNSEYVPALGGGNKSLIFGNFRYMAMRLAPDITVLRDPYSKASTGQVVLHYYFRTVYKVLQAEAIVYATNPTA